jgi:ParB family chromosome partitioning protein
LKERRKRGIKMLSEKAQLRMLSIEDLEFLPENPRNEIYDDALTDLAKSLQRDGLIEPIVVRPHNQKFEVVVGERRVRAAIIANIPRILAVVREGLTDKDASRLRLLENIKRKDLTLVEKVDGIKAHMEKNGLSLDQVAEELGLKSSTINKWFTDVENLAPSLKKDIAFLRKLSPDILALLGKYNFETQERLAKSMVNNNLTDWTARRYVAMFEDNPKADLDKLASKAKGQLKTIAVTLPKEEAEKIQKRAREFRKKEAKDSEKLKKYLREKRPRQKMAELTPKTMDTTVNLPLESPSIEGLRDLEVAKLSEEFKLTGTQFRKLEQTAKQTPNVPVRELAKEIVKEEMPQVMVMEFQAKTYNALEAYAKSEKVYIKEAALLLINEGLTRHGFLRGTAP